jgi:hypothetical protein
LTTVGATLKEPTVRFLMLVCRDDRPVANAGPLGDEIDVWVREMDSRGVRVTGDPLAPPDRAVTVRVRDGKVETAKGAFLDVGEALLGFDLLECENLEEAIEVASAHPLAKRMVLELRPIGE